MGHGCMLVSGTIEQFTNLVFSIQDSPCGSNVLLLCLWTYTMHGSRAKSCGPMIKEDWLLSCNCQHKILHWKISKLWQLNIYAK